MAFDKELPFKNWSDTSFEGLFGGEHYKFEAGGTYSVPSGMALHFARQLAVRELHKYGYNGNITRGEMLSDQDMQEYMDKCFPVKPKAGSSSSTFERIDVVSDAEAKPAKEVADSNKTVDDEQKENEDEDDEDDNAADEKNNAGAPVFKRPQGRPRKVQS